MFLERLNAGHALTVFALFFGSVGLGFAVVGDSQYVLIAFIISSMALFFNERFQKGLKQSDSQFIFGDNLRNLAENLIYGVLPAALLVRLTYTTLWGVIVAALYILAVGMRLSFFNGVAQMEEEDKLSPASPAGYTKGLPLEVGMLVIAVISLLGYVISPMAFGIVLAIVLMILGVAYVFNQDIPSVPKNLQLPIAIALLVLVLVYIFLGSFIPAYAA